MTFVERKVEVTEYYLLQSEKYIGTAKVVFEEVVRGGATGNNVTGSGPNRK
jgi:hypothetical protein